MDPLTCRGAYILRHLHQLVVVVGWKQHKKVSQTLQEKGLERQSQGAEQ